MKLRVIYGGKSDQPPRQQQGADGVDPAMLKLKALAEQHGISEGEVITRVLRVQQQQQFMRSIGAAPDQLVAEAHAASPEIHDGLQGMQPPVPGQMG